ncbi:M14 family zinc carboxypeptidase [Kribbella sp.]|uniref:M14 family zinc carboxypeptidase n=1 Tax=Kribbella sp. TaxID=1871183 RepID=UPI002D41AACD|nr:M14 family zinc carboxypeptidase [Kribbella sp.]HZX01894.1 M14 family zinc carboxypeptidase [Kribbella sp.]
MLPAWLETELQSVPEIAVFSTADELVADLTRLHDLHPALTSLRRIGTSRLGDPLFCLTIGSTGPDALVFGLPHPNEPIGGLTALHLARRLCTDDGLRERLGHRWHIVACIDPDGLRLNEGWLKGPFTREHYARNFYRPAGDEQIEWTFPLDYKTAYFDEVLPETAALMRVIDQVRPQLMCSLHNTEVGGAYYYLSRPEPELHGVLQEIPERLGLSLDRGEPESPSIERFADGIFRMPDIESMYDYYVEHEDPLPEKFGGNSSHSYTRPYGTLTLLSELPHWDDARVSDASPTTTSYSEVLREQAAGFRELVGWMEEILAATGDELTAGSAFVRASRYYARALAPSPDGIEKRAAEPEAQRPATVAELASVRDSVHMFRLRYAGMLLRALDGEVAIGNATPAIRAAQRRLAAQYDDWLADAAEAASMVQIPIGSLVASQYAALVATADHLTRAR